MRLRLRLRLLVMSLLPDPYFDPQTGEFEDYRRMVNTSALRVGILLTAAVQVPFVLFEWLALGEQFYWVQILRAVWLLPALALYPLSKTPSRGLLRRVDGIVWFIYVAAAVYIVFVSFLHDGYQSPYINALIMMFVGVTAVTLWPLWFAVSFAVAIYGAYLMPLILGYGSIGDLTIWIGYQGFMICTIGLLLVSQQLRMRMARADFDRRCQLEHEKDQTRDLLERVAVMRQERLNWLESLARFLRHELKNQMVAMSTSLDLAERDEAQAGPERYLNRARRSLARMGSLVQSATEATSIEAALTMGPNERVDLSGVVGERVFVFREAHPQRRFLADIEPGLELDGQEDRIAQLVDKLLDNAVEHGFEGGEVRVALMRADGWMLLAVENEGDPLPRDKQVLFDAFVSDKKSGNGRQNVGLGLFVARAIAQSHAGHIQALDIDGPSGARFEVRFPTEVR